LQTLCLAESPVADVAPLAGLPALKSVRLETTDVLDVTPLAGLPALASIDISHRWRSIDLKPLTRVPGVAVSEAHPRGCACCRMLRLVR
jgi:internalin A